MKTRYLRWLAVFIPLAFLGALDIMRHVIFPQLLHTTEGYVLVAATATIAIYLFSKIVFDHIDRIQGKMTEQQRALEATSAIAHRQAGQLRALHEAGLALVSTLSVEALLQKVVDLARELIGARYGALAIFDERDAISRFLTSGMPEEERKHMGELPKGRGLLGAVLAEGRPIRVDKISDDHRSIGFPTNHPRMETFLGVPIVARGRTLGNLYLTDKLGSNGVIPFDPEDEALLRLFAAQAAIAIENARLYSNAQAMAAIAERERIARELHDSLAQVLGYIRLQVGIARNSMNGQPYPQGAEALSRIDMAAEEAYADVREAILGLRSHVGAERDLAGALALYLERYRLQTGVKAELELGEGVREANLAPAAEAQLLRIIQEALTNVRKHAAASQVTVRLERSSDSQDHRLRATVTDNGRGFNPNHPPSGVHFGLATMSERSEAVGGQTRILSEPGQGTRVIVELPLEGAPGPARAETPGGRDYETASAPG